MKKLKLLFTLFIFISLNTHAQIPPNAFNYSAVARDAAGEPIANTTIGIQISILETSTVGPTMYVENHFVNTDDFGQFDLVIGAGATQSGAMETITWNTDNFYLQVGMDAGGGTNFLTMGTTQLLSVPYAMHSASADSLIGGVNTFSGDYNDLSNQPNLSTVATSGDYNDLTNQPITVSSISSDGDTLYLSDGSFFVSGNSGLLDPPTLSITASNVGSHSANINITVTANPEIHFQECGLIISTPCTLWDGGDPISGPGQAAHTFNCVVSESPGLGQWITLNTWNSTGTHTIYLGHDDNNNGVMIGQNYLLPNSTYILRAWARYGCDQYFYTDEMTFQTGQTGQTSPSGGIVIYDKGVNTDGWQYMEISPIDISNGAQWGCNGTTMSTETSFQNLIYGGGQSNTAAIVAGCNDPSSAAHLCNTYTLGGQSDWWLPSAKEWQLIGMTMTNLIGSYWTSNDAYMYGQTSQYAGIYESSSDPCTNLNNMQQTPTLKTETHKVRAIRKY